MENKNRKSGFKRNLVAIIAFALLGLTAPGCYITFPSSSEQGHNVRQEAEFNQRIGKGPYDELGIGLFDIVIWEGEQKRY